MAVKQIINCVTKYSDDIIGFGVRKLTMTSPEVLRFAPKTVGDTINISNVDKLKFLFPQNAHQSLNKEIRRLISELPLEHKMLAERGGQRITHPRYDYNGYGYTYSVNRFVHSSKGYTNSLDDCIAVLLRNTDDAYLYHLAPGIHKDKIAIADMQKGLSETIEKLEIGNKKCTAVLVGGQEGGSSVPLYENILSILNKYNIKPQEVLFADGHKSIYYDIKKGIVAVDDGLYNNIDELKANFQKVNI